MEENNAPGITHVVAHLGDSTQSVLNHYSKFYDEEPDQRSEERKENARDMVHSFYQLVTDFYEYGYSDSFHFAPVFSGKSLKYCLTEYERNIAVSLEAKPAMRLLDVGSGVGGPARTIAKLSGARVVGLNYCDYQIKRATALTEKANLQHLISYKKGDFCVMEGIEDNSFDGSYAIEATCHAEDLLKVYKQIFRVLKPGARFIDGMWCMTDRFDPENPLHQTIKHKILLGNALPDLHSTKYVLDKLREVGFEILEARDHIDDSELPWYSFLEGQRCCSLQGLRMSTLGRNLTHYSLSALETVKMVPKGTTGVHSVLLTAADALIASGKVGIFTPMFIITARKPLSE